MKRRAMKKSVVAKGYKTRAGANRAVFEGRKMKTVGGLKKDALTKSKSGKIVSKKVIYPVPVRLTPPKSPKNFTPKNFRGILGGCVVHVHPKTPVNSCLLVVRRANGSLLSKELAKLLESRDSLQ